MAVLLLTRPLDKAERFANQVATQVGVIETVISPVLSIQPVPHDLPPNAAGFIFTSQTAVGFAPQGGGRPAYAVGEATAQAAAGHGYQVIRCDGDAEAVIRRIGADAPRGLWVHLHGDHTIGNVAERLRDLGVNVQGCVTYRQLALPLTQPALSALNGEKPVILPLFSPRSAVLVSKSLTGTAPVWAVMMSENVKQHADLACFERYVVAERPDAKAMCVAIAGLIDAGR